MSVKLKGNPKVTVQLEGELSSGNVLLAWLPFAIVLLLLFGSIALCRRLLGALL
jgi:hypothetical protein